MPIYEFRCKDCGQKFETLCRMGSTGEGLNCPSCAGDHVARVMSTFAARVSGNGGSPSPSACSSCSSKSCST